MSLPLVSVHKAYLAGLILLLIPSLQAARSWNEINIGPYFVDTDGPIGPARDLLTRLEQARWVLGNLLEDKELQTTWPVRIVLTASAPKSSCTFVAANPGSTGNSHHKGQLGFVSPTEEAQFSWQEAVVLHAQYLLVCPSASSVPMMDIIGLFLEANTARLPADVESGVTQLFETLEAKGSHVTWGGPPAHLNLASARMQLFATKFEYSASFHIFLSALKGGSSLRSAEANAFGRPADELEKEAAALLSSGNWPSIAVSGRPLDPRRDFGEHSIDSKVMEVYLADAQLPDNFKAAEAAYKAAIEAGGTAIPLGFEGLAQLAQLDGTDPTRYLDDAARADSRSAPVYVASAEDLPTERMIQLLKKAAMLNPRWAEPIYRQAKESEDRAEQETLLKKATHIAPREPKYWMELANVQIANGHASVAQGSWMRAEEAAATDTERSRIHELRMANEQERLDAAEAARRAERDSARKADQNAQKSYADRVRAAEEKANQSLNTEAGGAHPAEVVPWKDVVPEKKIQGRISRVDCLGKDARLTLEDRTGRAVSLLLKDIAASGISCGAQKPALSVSLSYAAQPDERLGTVGTILTLTPRQSR